MVIERKEQITFWSTRLKTALDGGTSNLLGEALADFPLGTEAEGAGVLLEEGLTGAACVWKAHFQIITT